MDIVWIAALAVFWLALVLGVEGLKRLATTRGGRS